MQSCASPAPSNNPPGVKLLPSCRRTLTTHHCLPGGTTFPLWGTPTHRALHAFMVLVALWPACSPRLSAPPNNLPRIKLYPPCSRPLTTHYCLPGGNCSLFESPLLADPTPTKHRDDNDAWQQRHATRRTLSDNNAKLG